ncbi:General negative regulator of transcription subunit 1 [Smittium culicis]|uniref:General negative regulator of transcription subunit 1 n=1 Tax=Smittium culicis TaxID=133412 RepID=A0A1R1Y662_9FUNG|nr:General negative regulator of transcription subunit 1 [Smittium culicis]OMJ29173.1 General negative regulator of transcription subunit 1 [Smittium culicis]
MDPLENLSKINPQDISSSVQLADLLANVRQNMMGAGPSYDIDFVCSILNRLCSNEDKSSAWDPALLGEALVKIAPEVSWFSVLSFIPESYISFSGKNGLILFVKTWIKAVSIKEKNPKPYFPIGELCKGWADQNAKFNFIKIVPELGQLADLNFDFGIPVLSPALVESFYVIYRPSITKMVSSVWNSLNLLQSLVQFLDTSFKDHAQPILDRANQEFPILITLGLIRLKSQNFMQFPLIQQNSTRFLLRKHPDSILFFNLLRTLNRSMLLSILCSLYRSSSALLRPSLDVLVSVNLHLDILLQPRVDDLTMLDFILELAVLASRRGYIVFDAWFVSMLTDLGSDIIHPALEVIQIKIQNESTRQRGESEITIEGWVIEELETIFSALSHISMSANNTANLKALYLQYVSLLPELKSLAGVSSKISDEMIEKDAENLFLKLYRGDLNLEKMLEILSALRDSPQVYKRRTYAHAVQYPIDEYKFFSNYPEKELTTTAFLVGQLVRRHMYSPTSEATVIDLVKDSLLSGASTKTFQFGVVAMQQFSERLETWPSFCIVVSQIPQIMQRDPETANLVKSIMSTHLQLPSKSNGTGVDDPLESQGIPVEARNSTDKFTAIQSNIHSLSPLLKIQEEPSEPVKDKIQFALNNLSLVNIETKTMEVKSVLDVKHCAWLSSALVKRAGQEPNYHDIYFKFIEFLGIDPINDFLLSNTLKSITKLLNSESTVSSSRDRGQLGNLGSWLGGMTLARNKPLIRNNISLKALLIQGYESDRLIVAIPFVCKVLKQCSNSYVFKPPNPWLMRTISVLVELYTTAELKLNLKFEIEVLCRALGLDIKSITPSQIVRDHMSHTTDALIHDLGSSNNSDSENYRTASKPSPAIEIPTLTASDITIDIMSALFQHAQFNLCGSLFNSQPAFKKLFFVLAEKFILETIPIHIARSVYVATSATRDTVQRDFCGEPNEERMHRAAQLMVRGLAGAQAVSLCRDQLKSKMYLGFREWLLSESLPESTANQLAAGLVSDNLDLACAIAEKEAIERASIQIDQIFAETFQVRKRTRERTGQPYYDMGTHSLLSYPTDCPDILRIKLASVPPVIMRIYDDFTQIPHFPSQVATPPSATGQTATTPVSSKLDSQFLDKNSTLAPNNESMNYQDSALNAPAIPVQQLLDEYCLLMAELEKLVSIAAPGASLATLPQTHVLRAYAKEILFILTKLNIRESPIIEIAQSLINQLLQTESRLGLELNILLLYRVCQIFPAIAREVSRWLTYSDNEDRFNVPVVLLLLTEGLVNSSQFDSQLAKLIDSKNLTVISFSVNLVRKAVIEQAISALPQDFTATIESLYQLYLQNENSNESPTIPKEQISQINNLIRDFKQYRNSSNDVFDESADYFSSNLNLDLVSNETSKQILTNWAQFNEISNVSDSTFYSLMSQTYQVIDLKNVNTNYDSHVDKISHFFSYCISYAIESFENELVSTGSFGASQDLNQSSLDPLSSFLSQPNDASASINMPNIRQPQPSLNDNTGISHGMNVGTHKGNVKLSTNEIGFINSGTPTINNSGTNNNTNLSSSDAILPEADSTSTIQNYQIIDGLAKMVIWMVRANKHNSETMSSDENKGAGNSENRIPQNISVSNSEILLPLKQFLNTYVLLLVKDHFGAHFSKKQKPYFRLLTIIINELGKASHSISGYFIDKKLHLEALRLIGQALLAVRPSFVAGFTFAWLSIVMNQHYLPILLENKYTWRLVEDILVAQLESLEPFVEKGVVTDSVCLLYRGTVRVILVILHDYPSFLTEHAFSLCDAVPVTCIQTRNLLLSAFTSGMALPEPFSSNMKMEFLESSNIPPRIGSDYSLNLRKSGCLDQLDNYILQGKPESFAIDIVKKLSLYSGTLSNIDQRMILLEGKSKYDIKLINSLVMHFVVMSAGGELLVDKKTIDPKSITASVKSNVLKLINTLLASFDFEGRYLLLSSFINHLRYPSTHTHYVSELLFTLFLDKTNLDLGIKELVTRVLIERVTVNQPFPWGLLVTVSELVLNPKYEFWSQSFSNITPQIKEILTVVASSFNPANANPSSSNLAGFTNLNAAMNSSNNGIEVENSILLQSKLADPSNIATNAGMIPNPLTGSTAF